jgi:hypothetical protein
MHFVALAKVALAADAHLNLRNKTHDHTQALNSRLQIEMIYASI